MFKGLIGISILALGASLAGAGWFVATAVLGAVLLLAYWLFLNATVVVPEMQIGVVQRQDSDHFVRFLGAGRHTIRPFQEKLHALIPMNPSSVNGRCEHTQTIGGLPLTIEWTLSYNLNPFRIPAKSQAKLARTLPVKSGSLAAKHVNNVIRHIISEYTVDQLTEPGAQKRLERQVRQLVAERLSEAGFEISRIMIGAIEMPAQVTAALAAAHERQLLAAHEAKALERLQQVVSQFSDADMERLLELERIHTMGRNGVTLMMPHVQQSSSAQRWAMGH